jgi:LuxR family transcriptional regulator, maltose regulon positive regulatory protein
MGEIVVRPSLDALLLSTKLKIPVPRKNYVVRSILFDQLSQCTESSVIFVRGGAGTGKTTLLASFIRERELKNVGWLSLDASNVNIYSFWLYFTEAINTFLPVDNDFLALMRSNLDASHMENLLVMLINRLCGEENYYLVIDDVHCIKDTALIRTIEFFIRAMPENFHFFLLSREDPPVYLGPLAVSGRLLFVDSKQMRLLPEEGIAFLKQTLKYPGSEEELSRLNDYAEGWIGGLQLVAAAETSGRYSENLLRAGGRIATEYLTREIFESLTQSERDFLIGTGFLAYFDADISTNLFDNFAKAQFDAMIESLTQKNLFIICIDEQNGIYRYHNILAEYLAQQFSQLPDERKKALYTKSAKVFELRGDHEEALREFYAAGDFDQVLNVARTMRGKIEAWNYLDKVPFDKLILDADLAAQCFMYNLGNLKIDRCRLLYDKFREYYGDTDVFRAMQFAEIYILTDISILPEYHTLTSEQIDSLNFGPVTKAIILVENSAALLSHTHYEEAEKCVKRAIQTCAGANIFADFFAYNQMAQIYEEIGHLNESLASYKKSRELFKSPWMASGISTNYYFGIAGVYMLQMDLDKAMEALTQSQRLLEAQHIHENVTNITLIFHLAEVEFLSGNADAGASCVERIISEYPIANVLMLGRLLLELDCSNLLSPKLADEFLKEIERAENYKIQLFMKLLKARLLFKRGKIAEASKETEDVLIFSRTHKNRLRLVEADLLKIFMLSHRPEMTGNRREIINLLREAIYYAHKDRIRMPFYLDRVVLLPLLHEIAAQTTSKSGLSAAEIDFVRSVITLCGETDTIKPKGQEILSIRELEVLGEMAQGITNREIAEKLCISQATVKTHVLSIFGKLGVSSRMLAVDEGRKKGLIQ